jgi:hypothetical protein
LKDLLSAISLAEVRFTFRSLGEGEPVAPRAPRTRELEENVPAPAAVHLHDPEITAKIARILARGKTAPVPKRRVEAPVACEAEMRAEGGSRWLGLAMLVLVLGLAGLLWNRSSAARERATAAEAERLALEAQWHAMIPQVEEALAVRSKIEKARGVSALVGAERVKPRWTPALRSVVPKGDAGIDILEVEVRGDAKDSGACEMRVRGVAGGAQPRMVADRFRQTTEESLRTNANGHPVSTRFDQLTEVRAETTGQLRATFVMIARLGPAKPAVATRKEER